MCVKHFGMANMKKIKKKLFNFKYTKSEQAIGRGPTSPTARRLGSALIKELTTKCYSQIHLEVEHVSIKGTL